LGGETIQTMTIVRDDDKMMFVVRSFGADVRVDDGD
jgi:hypothetical protein